jgi:ribose/xylose/arabinose/galactoside ABC-type transport system permease subunit
MHREPDSLHQARLEAGAAYDLADPMGRARIAGLPLSVIILLALIVATGVLMSETVFGRHVYAIGGDSEAARCASLNVNRVDGLVEERTS